jgi:hypothetical protein
VFFALAALTSEMYSTRAVAKSRPDEPSGPPSSTTATPAALAVSAFSVLICAVIAA